jgi:tetratricopeptide (TPR) repeat protein
MSHVHDSLEAGREAAARFAWREAFDLLSAADSDGTLTATDVDMLAQAAWWTGRLEEALALRERAYAAYMREGDEHSAAVVALTLADDYGLKAAGSVANGWLQRAERILGEKGETTAHAQLELARSFNAQRMGDFTAGVASAERAYELGTRLADRDIQAYALVLKGRALTRKGEVAEGLALLDEATAAAVSGELKPVTTCAIYCVTISSCQGVGDYRRAVEWTQAANRWCNRLEVSGFPGACRIHTRSSCDCKAIGHGRRRKHCRRVKSCTTSTAGSPPEGSTRSVRSVVVAATSKRQRRRSTRQTSSATTRSPVSRC